MPRASRSYCKTTPISRMGFSQRASCKAQGLIKRTGKSNKGKYLKSTPKGTRRKYKKSIKRRSKRSKRSKRIRRS